MSLKSSIFSRVAMFWLLLFVMVFFSFTSFAPLQSSFCIATQGRPLCLQQRAVPACHKPGIPPLWVPHSRTWPGRDCGPASRKDAPRRRCCSRGRPNLSYGRRRIGLNENEERGERCPYNLPLRDARTCTHPGILRLRVKITSLSLCDNEGTWTCTTYTPELTF